MEQCPVVDASRDVLTEEAVLVLAEAVEGLPLRFSASPFDSCERAEQKKENGRSVRADGWRLESSGKHRYFGVWEKNRLPSAVVPGLSVRLQQLVDLVRRQGVGDSLGVLGEYLFELVRNKPEEPFQCLFSLG